MDHVYDIGINIPTRSTDSDWDDISQFLEEVIEEFGLYCESSGCGFGVRDAQLCDSKGQEDLTDKIRERATGYGLELDYLTCYEQD